MFLLTKQQMQQVWTFVEAVSGFHADDTLIYQEAREVREMLAVVLAEAVFNEAPWEKLYLPEEPEVCPECSVKRTPGASRTHSIHCSRSGPKPAWDEAILRQGKAKVDL